MQCSEWLMNGVVGGVVGQGGSRCCHGFMSIVERNHHCYEGRRVAA